MGFRTYRCTEQGSPYPLLYKYMCREVGWMMSESREDAMHNERQKLQWISLCTQIRCDHPYFSSNGQNIM